MIINEKERIEEAKKIASELGIEFYSVDCTKEYEKIVLDNSIIEKVDVVSGYLNFWVNTVVLFWRTITPTTLPKLPQP